MRTPILRGSVWRSSFFIFMLLLAFLPAEAKIKKPVPAPDDDLEQLKAVFSNFFNPGQFNLTGLNKADSPQGGSDYSGDATFFGITPVKLKVHVKDGFKVQEAIAEFPAEAKFEPLLGLNRLMNTMDLQQKLPESLLRGGGLNIKSFTLKLGEDGKSFESFSSEIASSAWDFMGYGGIKMNSTSLTLFINNSPAGKTVGGKVQGVLNLAGGNINVDATLTNKKEDFEVKGSSAAPIKLGSLIESLGGADMKKEFEGMVPGGMMNSIEIPIFAFTANPGAGRFSLKTTASVGAQELNIRKNGGQAFFSYSYLPNTNFKFAELGSSLAWLDQSVVKFKDVRIRVSNDPENRVVRTGNPPIGLDVEATLVPTSESQAYLGGSGGQKLVIRGGVDASFNVMLALETELNLEFGGGWKYEKSSFYLENKIGSRGPVMGMRGSLLIPIDGTKLRFQLGLNGQPAAAAMGGELHLESINDDGNMREWREPFGIPYVTFNNLGGAVGFSGSTLIDHVGLKGNLKLGAMPSGDTDRRLAGTVDTKLDVDIGDSWVKGSLNKFSILAAIQAFHPNVELPGEVANFLSSGVEDAKVDINPQAKSLEIAGKSTFYGMKGNFSMKAGKSGVAAGGGIDAIHIRPGGVRVLDIHGFNGENDPASFKIDLSAEPRVDVSGKMEILGMASSQSSISIDKNGFNIKSNQKILGNVLSGDVEITGSDFVNTGNMRMKLDLNLDVIGNLKQKLTDYIRKEAGSVAAEIVDAIIPQFGLKKVQMNTGLQDLKMESTFNVEFVAGMFGEVETFGVDVKARLDMNSIDGFILSLVESIGKSLLDNFNFLEKAWEEFSEFAEDAYKETAKAMEAVAGEFEKGMEMIGTEVASWFEDRHFDSPQSGPAKYPIAPGYRHIKATVTSIEIVSADEGNGDDVFGRVSLAVSGGGVYYAPSTNVNFFGRSENEDHGNKGAGSRIPVNNTKHFYLQQGSSATVSITGELWEEDTGGDDRLNSPGKSHTVNDATTTITDYWDATEGGSRWRIHYKIEAQEAMNSAKLVEAINRGDMNLLQTRINYGGDIRKVGNEAVDGAAKNRNKDMLALLEQVGKKANANHLTASMASGFDQQVCYQLMKMGAVPNTSHLDKAIDNKASGLAEEMIRRGAAPNIDQMRKSLNSGQYGVAEQIMRKGIKPESSDLGTWLDKKNTRVVNMLLAHHAPVSPANITTAVNQQYWEVLDDLLMRAKPEQAAYVKAAQLNNTEVFAQLARSGEPITDMQPPKSAVDNNNMEILKICLQNGAAPTTIMTYSMTKNNIEAVEKSVMYGGKATKALGFAMEKNNEEFFKRLLTDYGADGNSALANAYTADNLKYVNIVFENASADPSRFLAEASEKGKWEMVDVMLKYGGNPNLAMKGAVDKENVDLLNRLLNQGAKANKAEFMETSAKKGSMPMMRSLLAYGADPNPGMKHVIDADNYAASELLLRHGANPKGHMPTPASRGKADIVKLLLMYGADPNEGMKGATSNLHEPVVKMLLDHGASPAGYMDSPARQGHLGIVKLLVEYGADPNEGLRGAVEGNHYPVAEYLIDYGARPKGLTAAAAGNGNLKMVMLVVDNGDDPEPGMVPAIRGNHMEIMTTLVEKYKVDPKKQEYLIAAVDETEGGSHGKIAKYLLENGSDPNKYRETKTGNSLLHIVADKGRKKDRDLYMVKVLIQNGANMEARNEDGWTCLHMAANKARKNFDMVKFMVDNGADVNACTNKDKSVLKIAEGKEAKNYLEEHGAEKKACKDKGD